ncbi:hypothetical protein A1D25_07135 [Ursidibacter arcticus]|uniref:SMI1/KNR4 family protein n=1 Tax=Ursidibacter arcticus TaxID=1524965 RepID=UPI0012FAD254|nr:SMI1/KNR4 family protein [Ursidibacter arcticus]KAE9534121.1 hypothetical protein A1D25_07135 [Ursidibacter arcticus]
MKDINWKYVKPLENHNIITEFENQHNVLIPEDLKSIIKQFNNGRPSLNQFDIPSEKGKVFKKLLSFNTNDTENVFDFLDIETDITSLIAFASDPSGNLICLKDNKIFYWKHETDEIEKIADTFSELLENLY